MGRGGSNPPSDTPTTCRNDEAQEATFGLRGFVFPKISPRSLTSCTPGSLRHSGPYLSAASSMNAGDVDGQSPVEPVPLHPRVPHAEDAVRELWVEAKHVPLVRYGVGYVPALVPVPERDLAVRVLAAQQVTCNRLDIWLPRCRADREERGHSDHCDQSPHSTPPVRVVRASTPSSADRWVEITTDPLDGMCAVRVVSSTVTRPIMSAFRSSPL